MALKLRKLSHALGAEVCGIDVGAPLSEAAFGEIYQAFLDNGILLFRDQDITREQHIQFSRRFGELDQHESLPRDRHPRYPELLLVTNEPNADGTPSNSRYTGRQWHSDMSFTLIPSLGSLLKSWAVPEVGGDTLFANMTLAYDTLSAGMKKLIADLHGIQLAGTRKINHLPTGLDRLEEQKKLNPPVAQPVVRVQSAVPRRQSQTLRRHDRRRKPAADQIPERACHKTGIRLSSSMAQARHPGVGQPLHHAPGAGRFRRNAAPSHGTHHGARHAVRLCGGGRITVKTRGPPPGRMPVLAKSDTI
jgi:alpha-ketoglutarate-dependent taurine dioxygenase